MIQPEINSAVIIAFVAFTLGMVAIVSVYGPQMIKDRWKETGYPEGTILSTDVYQYFEKQGYKAFHISPVKNTTNWRVFIIKEGVLYVCTVFTNGQEIIEHDYTIA
jgi:hypothetical protein